MRKRTHRIFSYQGLRTNTDFAKQATVLAKRLSKNTQGNNNALILINAGWLYDQWALIASIKRKKVYQEKAVIFFNQALRKGASKESVYNGLGTVALHKEAYKKALGYYKKVHILRKDSRSYNALGNVYRRMKKYTLAEKHYRAALRLAKHPLEKSAADFNLEQLKNEMSKK